ncbi:MAG TPA: hypothetical protein VL093_01865 [Flavipsychrobacter sp.]|nr:hypothetical protein [Flavipsychrobacter sp.]
MNVYNKLQASLILRKCVPQKKHYRNYRTEIPELYAEITIDSRHLFYPQWLVYPQELIASATQSGEYFIFCNGCGVAYCGCREIYKTTVIHYKESVVWRVNKAAGMRSYRFRKAQYVGVINELEQNLDISLRRYKKQLQQWKMRSLPYELWEGWCQEHRLPSEG